jgi:Rab-like protein 3
MASSLAPERVRHVRVAVVGDSGCGKSTLVNVLAGSVGDDARVSDAPVPRTVGVNARVRVVDVPDARGVAPPRPHFVELWDLGGRDEHEAERRVFYRDLDGVLLVHDLTLPRAARGLERWARDVAANATFATPTPDHCDWNPTATQSAQSPEPHVLRGFGGLPVPALVVANKADLDRSGGEARFAEFDPAEASARLARVAWAKLARVLRLPRRWRGEPLASANSRERGRSLLPIVAGDLAPLDPGSSETSADRRAGDGFASPPPAGLRCAAVEARVDLAAFDSFFRELIARKYDGRTASDPGGDPRNGSLEGDFVFSGTRGGAAAFGLESAHGGAIPRPGSAARWAEGGRIDE